MNLGFRLPFESPKRVELSVVVELGLLLGLDYGNALDEVFMGNKVTVSSQGNHTGFDADSLHLSAVELFSTSCNFPEVDLLLSHIHLSGVDFQNLESGVFSWEWEFNLSIKSTTSEQGRVENIWSICGCDDLDVGIGAESIKL